jgi:hypothetical protein
MASWIARRCVAVKNALHVTSGSACAGKRGKAIAAEEVGARDLATIGGAMADQTPSQPLDQQLEEIGAQLAWVRDYL